TYEPMVASRAAAPRVRTPTQYTGRDNDGTGLFYYRARYYNPTLQQFISEDPIGFAGGRECRSLAVDLAAGSGHADDLHVLRLAVGLAALDDGRGARRNAEGPVRLVDQLLRRRLFGDVHGSGDAAGVLREELADGNEEGIGGRQVLGILVAGRTHRVVVLVREVEVPDPVVERPLQAAVEPFHLALGPVRAEVEDAGQVLIDRDHPAGVVAVPV